MNWLRKNRGESNREMRSTETSAATETPAATETNRIFRVCRVNLRS